MDFKMRSLKNSVKSRSVKKELIVIDLDDYEDDFCDEDSTYIDVPDVTNQTRKHNDNADAYRFKSFEDVISIDRQFKKFLDCFREEGNSYVLEISKKDIKPICIRYGVDNGRYDKRICSRVINKRAREVKNTKSKVISKASKSLNIVTAKKGVLQCVKKIQKSKKIGESKARIHVQTSRKKEEGGLKRAYVKKTVITASKESVASKSETRTHVKGNPQHNDETKSQKIVDEVYRSYLTWLVNTERNPKVNPTKEVKVKCEKYTMSSSDSDIIAIANRPFQDAVDSPFVPLKDDKVIDLDEDGIRVWDQRNSWYRKEITKVLKQPYNEKEFLELYNDASVRKRVIRCRELRNGRDITYPTKQRKPSYLSQFPDFRQKFRASYEYDRHRALNLLRGFFFYLKNVSHEDSFKPWLDDECLKIMCF